MNNNFDIQAWNRNRLIESTLDDAELKAKKRVEILTNSILKAFPDLDKLELKYAISSGFTDLAFDNLLESEINGDKVDIITTDVPLFIRLLEYAKEDAETDMDLHNITENIISIGKEIEKPLTMENYNNIINQK